MHRTENAFLRAEFNARRLAEERYAFSAIGDDFQRRLESLASERQTRP